MQPGAVATEWYARLEAKLQHLDSDAWTALKNEAAQYLGVRCPDRGWPQLFDILSQADAYKYLRELGCSEIHFIPRADIETPDLEGLLGSRKVLCESKRMRISDQESNLRGSVGTPGTYERPLNSGFFRKLESHINRAKAQVHAHDPQGEARHIVYVSICFDEPGGFNREDELRQVQQYLDDRAPWGIEVVFGTWI